MSERRAGTKGRRLGSSRRRQIREGSSEVPEPAPGPGEEQPWPSEIVQRVQDFLRERDKDQAGFVTRSDMQKFQEEGFPCSTEELELVFDGLDAAGTGRLSSEEFTAGLRQFLSSQKAAREHRRRKTASRRVRLVLPSPALEGVDSEDRRHFAAFMDQLGTDNVSEEQEIWQLWVKLQQDEPQLLGNLEEFLAKMRHRIQEARREKEALEVTLNKRVAEHDKEVQQLCEVLEQQIQQEQQRLEQTSVARSHQQDAELRRVLDASEREVQRLVTAQMELERRCRSLRSAQQITSTENRELEESNRMLEDHLQHLHRQLKQTQGHLRTMRAWEHVEEPGDRALTEVPGEMPMSPQMSPGKSEKFRSEMRIRLGSQSDESKAKNTHQVVWEVLPAEISISGAPPGASSAEEELFPENLKEEHLSDQSSLLREMNDAIAALSKHLKAQAPGAPPALADTASHPRDDAEPQTGQEAATAHGTTPEVLQDTLPGHISHELFEGDLKEGPATAEFRALDVTQAGGSVGAGHYYMAKEPGAEQGESPEEAQRMIFLPGKGAGVKEMVLKVTEHLGESKEAGEEVEVEGEGWTQGNTGWEKAQLLGEAEEAGMRQGESLEAGLGPPEAGQAGLAVGQCLAVEELQPGAAPGECVPTLGMAPQEWADPSWGLSGKLETELGEHLEPEPPSQGEAQVGAAQGDGVTPEVAVAPGPGVLEEEEEEEEDRVSAELQSRGEPSDAEGLPAPAEHGMSCSAGGEEEEVEETQPREAELQPQGGSVRGDAGRGGSAGDEVPLVAAVPLLDVQEGGMRADVEQLEAQNSDTNTQLPAQEEADPQVSSEAGSPGTEQGGSVDPSVQPLEEEDEPQVGLGEERGAAEVHSEGPSSPEAPAGSSDLCGLFPFKSQPRELVEAEDAQADVQLSGGLSPETLWGVKGGTDVQIEEEDGAQGQEEPGLPQEPVLEPHGAAVGQGEGVGTGVQPQEEDENLDTTEDQSTDGKVQLLAEVDELTLIPGGSTESDLQPLAETDSLESEQGGSVDPGVQPLDQVNAAELVEMVETEDSWRDKQLSGDANPETSQQEGNHPAMELGDEAEDWGQGQGEHGLPQEPVLDMLEGQSSGVNVQLLAEEDELRLTPGGSTEADLQPLSVTDSLGTEQGGSVDPGVLPLGQVDKAELVEMETQDSWTDMQLCGSASPETPQGKEDYEAVQLRDEAEDGGQGLGEPVLDTQGSRAGQGVEAGAGVQTREEAESLGTLEGQSTGANMQLSTEEDELKSASGGSSEADLAPLDAAGMWEGEQSLTPGVGAGLCAAHITDTWEGAAAAHVPPPAEADSYPEPVTAAEGLGLEAKPGAPAGPDGQILGDTQALELPQGERAAAEGRPLDGAQGLEVVQGERLEAGARSVDKTQGLGRRQGHDDGMSAPAPPLSEVPSQTGPVKLETVMQEDVLIPDVWRVCASGQAAQSELQEQVSAQGHPVRIHAPAQRPEGKTPRVMEPEQVAAGPAEPPKQEVPPGSTLHLRVQPQEDAGNDQLGVVLADLGELQRQLLGEQSEDLGVGKREKPQELGQKMSQEGEPSPGEPEAVAAEGAGAAPEGCPKAPLDPDHLYNVLFVGDSHVGKTSFLYRLHADSFNPNLTATVGLDYRIKNLVVDNKRFALRLWDSAGQERYHSMTKQFFRKADGVVLMYDITSQYSFSDVRYWLSCIQEAAEDGVAVLLLGNKTDRAAERQVPVKEGECLAKEHQLMFYECSAASGHNVLESMVSFVRLLKDREDELKNKAEEVPKAPQKKKYCCW